MDGDPAVEPELDSLSLTLPLPYRVAFIIVAAVWAWGANLQYLSATKIDVPSLIRYPARSSHTQPSHHLSTYRLATILTICYTFSLLLFWAITRRNPARVIEYDWMPMGLLVLIAALFIIPTQNLSQTGRYRFLATLKRVSLGNIATNKNGKFGDILLADVLTSYAKVIADLFVAICMFFTAGGSATQKPDRACGGQFVVPLIIAIPSIIRLRQCVIEFLRVQRANERSGNRGNRGWGGQHLANALKYSTAFPVIILSALQRNLSFNQDSIGLSEAGLYRLWLLAVMVNSFYSFWWDVTKDWDLTLLSSAEERNAPDHPFGLRRRLYFRSKELYYVAIGVDFLLRCTWSLKLSPHLDHFNDWEGGIFIMEFLEVFRRWVWIFFRVETEWGRSTNSGLGPGPDDVLLLMEDFRDED